VRIQYIYNPMEIQFVKLNPTENMTILVESPAERSQYPEIAGRLMAYGSVCAEQTGFIEAASDPAAWARLWMAGGEFCGNASMSLAAYLVWRRKLPEGEAVTVPFETSGAPGPVECVVVPKAGEFHCSLDMPLPEAIETLSLPFGGVLRELPAVRLPGIIHVIVPVEAMDCAERESRGFAEKAAGEWGDIIGADAFGVILFNRAEGKFRITPLVRVKSPGSLIWERGCGSGSAAVGAYLADQAKAGVELPLAQAGGVIGVKAQWERGMVTALTISGTVRVAARGTAYI
jgi:diaminopimelate epimerase